VDPCVKDKKEGKKHPTPRGPHIKKKQMQGEKF
jgi:hypothetical protein